MACVGLKEVRGIIEHFEELPDPRSAVNQHHLLVDVIVISICGVIAGADGPVAIEQWAEARHAWLKKLLRLPHGIPSHDTIGRVLAALRTAVINKRAGGMGLISGRKAFQRPLKEGIQLLNRIQDVYLDNSVTIA